MVVDAGGGCRCKWWVHLVILRDNNSATMVTINKEQLELRCYLDVIHTYLVGSFGKRTTGLYSGC